MLLFWRIMDHTVCMVWSLPKGIYMMKIWKKKHLNNNCLDILNCHALVVKCSHFTITALSLLIGMLLGELRCSLYCFLMTHLRHFYGSKTSSDRPHYLELLYKSANTLEDALFCGYGLFSAADIAQLYLIPIASQACPSSCCELSLGLLLNSIICLLLDYAVGCQKRNKT